MDFSWPLVVAGALVGVSVGLTGMGGGALMTPIMVMIFGVDPTAAIGSDLLASVAMKPVGAAVHQRAGTVRWDLVRWLVPTAVPAGFAGAFVLHLFGDGPVLQHRVKLAIGVALLLAVAGMAARVLLARRRETSAYTSDQPIMVRRIPTLIIGLVGGLIVGMTSVGSGSLIIVMLMLVHPRLRASHLVGTDLVQAIPLVAAAAAGHLVAGDTRLGLAGVLLIGAIPGIYLGAKLATRAPSGLLRWVLAILLLGSGLSLWHVPPIATVAICVGMAITAVIAATVRRYRPDSAAAGLSASGDGAVERVSGALITTPPRPGR
ncbi:MAG: sulfite exporter TauE/SafE family protein [Sciscionella sp.]